MVGQNLLSHEHALFYRWHAPTKDDLNLVDFQTTLRFLRSVKPDLIIHAAGVVGGILVNMREPSRFLIQNLDMGRNILLAAAEVGIPRLINFGSTCMYPKNRQNALQEHEILTGQLEPSNEGYALAKITVAKLAQYISTERSNLDYKTLVSSNLYGPHDNFDPVSSHMIPAAIHKLHVAKEVGSETVEIWGSGEARREFLYVEDLVNAVFKSIENFEGMPSIMNIGLGHDYTVNEYYGIAAAVVGFKGRFHHNLGRPEGMQRKLSDITLAREWGWSPQHSVYEGMKKTYDFYKSSFLKAAE